MAVDGQGNIFIADTGNSRVQKWAPGARQGITVAGGHGAGTAANQLNGAVGLTVDGQGHLFVGDAGNYRVQEFTLPTANPVDPSTTALTY